MVRKPGGSRSEFSSLAQAGERIFRVLLNRCQDNGGTLCLDDLKIEASAFEAMIRAGIENAEVHAACRNDVKSNRLQVLMDDQGPAFVINAHCREAISSTFSPQLHLSQVDWRIAVCETLADIAAERYRIDLKKTVEAAYRTAMRMHGTKAALGDIILDPGVEDTIAMLRDRLTADICEPAKRAALTDRINEGLTRHFRRTGRDPLLVDEAQMKMFAVKLNNRASTGPTWSELGG